MGFCADPTPDMGPYSIESRSSSVIIRSTVTEPGPGAIFLRPDDDSGRIGGFEVDADQLEALIAALEQARRVRDHGAAYQWARRRADGKLEPVEVVRMAVDLSTITGHPDVVMAALAVADHQQRQRIADVCNTAAAANYSVDDFATIAADLNNGPEPVAEIGARIAAAVDAAREQWTAAAAAALT